MKYTEDYNIKVDLFLKTRNYVQRVEPKAALYTDIKLAQQKKWFRVVPGMNQTKNIINYWLINCIEPQEVLFPILHKRQKD